MLVALLKSESGWVHRGIGTYRFYVLGLLPVLPDGIESEVSAMTAVIASEESEGEEEDGGECLKLGRVPITDTNPMAVRGENKLGKVGKKASHKTFGGVVPLNLLV